MFLECVWMHLLSSWRHLIGLAASVWVCYWSSRSMLTLTLTQQLITYPKCVTANHSVFIASESLRLRPVGSAAVSANTAARQPRSDGGSAHTPVRTLHTCQPMKVKTFVLQFFKLMWASNATGFFLLFFFLIGVTQAQSPRKTATTAQEGWEQVSLWVCVRLSDWSFRDIKKNE